MGKLESLSFHRPSSRIDTHVYVNNNNNNICNRTLVICVYAIIATYAYTCLQNKKISRTQPSCWLHKNPLVGYKDSISRLPWGWGTRWRKNGGISNHQLRQQNPVTQVPQDPEDQPVPTHFSERRPWGPSAEGPGDGGDELLQVAVPSLRALILGAWGDRRAEGQIGAELGRIYDGARVTGSYVRPTDRPGFTIFCRIPTTGDVFIKKQNLKN